MPLEKPLYTLFGELENYVRNRDECGSIVGYTLTDSLLHFSTTSGAVQDIKFEQVRDFYKKLGDNIDHCRRDKSDNPGFNVLCTLEEKLQPELKYDALRAYLLPEPDLEGKKKENRTNMRNALVESLTKRTHGYEDRLRRVGLALMDSVKSSRTSIGTREVLNQDYDAIAGLFK